MPTTAGQGKAKIPYEGFISPQSFCVPAALKNQLAKFLREKRGELTLLQFARKLGISDSTLQRLEIGEQNLTLKSLQQIVDRLNCEIADIFPSRNR